MMTEILSAREKKAFLEDLRGEFSVPLDVIVVYTEILLDQISLKKDLQTYILDLKKIMTEGKILQKYVEDAFNSAVNEKPQKNDIYLLIRNLQHTLVTPLNSIIGYCELLIEDGFCESDEQIEKDLKTIHEAAKLFIGYINKISTVAQTEYEGGNLVSHFEKSSLIVRKVVTSIPSLEETHLFPQAKKEGTILIVDDSSMELDLICRLVESYGYSAIRCEKGEYIFDILQLYQIDLVILQIVMKTVSGFDILMELKRSDAYRRLPVIILSPLREFDSAVRCYEFGADDYMTRPFSSIIFKAKINNLIEKKKLLDREQIYLMQLREEKDKSQALLLNILPQAIANRLIKGEKYIADRYEIATILFTDIVGFTKLAESLKAQELISILNKLFSKIDLLVQRYKVEKIKTIGDSYMAVAGVPEPMENHAEAMAEVGLGILEIIEDLNREENLSLQVRIGLHSGPIIAGIIGFKKFVYDLWGRTVNFASRMESQGQPGKIQVSQATYDLLKDKYSFEPPRTVQAKGIGEVLTYFLIKRIAADVQS